MPKLLGSTELTTRSIERALISADQHHREESGATEWPAFYAQFFIDRFGTSATD